LNLQGNQAYVDSNNNVLTCAVCDQPTDLTRDLTTDERGRAVHQQCYDERLLSSLGRWGKQLNVQF
jgi:hypothetical protein